MESRKDEREEKERERRRRIRGTIQRFRQRVERICGQVGEATDFLDEVIEIGGAIRDFLNQEDLLDEDPAALPYDVVLAGDIFYAAGLARRGERWLRAARAAGRSVLVGDAGRAYVPAAGIRTLAVFEVPVPPDLEGVSEREARVLGFD